MDVIDAVERETADRSRYTPRLLSCSRTGTQDKQEDIACRLSKIESHW
jgi:hypothetical protein